MSAISTAEFERLSLIAAGVDPSQIPPILDTATWRRLLIAGLLKNAANQAISGQVDNYSQLPITVGAPAIGATYLVKYSSGIYYINYKSAGIYVKVADTGSLTDWVYAPLSSVGTLPDANITSPQIGQTLVYDGTKWVNSSIPNYFDVRFQTSDLVLNPGFTDLGGTPIPVVVAGSYKVSVHAHLIATGGVPTQILCKVNGPAFFDGGIREKLIPLNSPPDTGPLSSSWVVSTGNNSGIHIFEYYVTVGQGNSIAVQYSSNGATLLKGSNYSVTRVVN